MELQNYKEIDFVVLRKMKDGTKRYSIPMSELEAANKKAVSLNDNNGDTFVIKRTTTVKERVV